MIIWRGASLLFFLLLSYWGLYGQTKCTAVDLHCEYQPRPLNIDMQHPRLSWRLKDDRRGADQTAYQVMVASDSLLLKEGKPDIWNTGRVISSQSNAILYEGKSLTSRGRYYWSVTVWDKDGKKSIPSAIASWETGLFRITDWRGSWINDGKDTSYKPAPYFRKSFLVKKGIKQAKLYICGLGYYELSINGKKVGDHILDPGFTRFDKTDLYVAYDVTSYLQQEKNAIGVVLGNGWFNEQSRETWYFDKAPWRLRPRLLLNLYITYDDDETICIASDTSWKVSTGDIIFNNIYSGEYIDDRLSKAGWNTPEFNDASWVNAMVTDPPGGKLKAQLMPPIRIKQEIKPVDIKKFNDRTYVFDMGQNFAGLSRLKVSGERGTVIQLKHGESLFPNGRIDNKDISMYAEFTDSSEQVQTDRFILNGNGIETFQPHFTYHGYRYVEVTADRPIELDINSITGLVAHTDVQRIGQFSCSDTLINRIYNAGIWSYLSNIHSIPTDCPQREKNGWTADGHFAAEMGLYNFDGILFYEKWIADHVDEQRPGGVLPAIIPTSGWGYHWGNGPDWCSGFLIIPWYVYLYNGEATLIKKYYLFYKKYVDYLTFRSHEYLLDFGLGDWNFYKTKTPADFTSSCYYYKDVKLLSQFAKLNGEEEDAALYADLAAKIKSAINHKYLDQVKMTYANGSQTAMSAALFQQVVPDHLKNEIARRLSDILSESNNHLDVGLLGSKYLLNALSDNGYNDLAFTVASQRTQPSWGWWMLQGQTTFQESWGIGISRNHIMYGEVIAWMFKHLAGILPDRDAPGFKHIILKPGFTTRLSHAKAIHETVYGTIRASWKKTKGKLTYDVTIPANTTATVYLPVPAGKKIYESKKLITMSTGIKSVKTNIDVNVYEIKAGEYHFEIR